MLTKNLLSGTVRLFYGFTISSIIGFSLDLGTQVYSHAIGITKQDVILDTYCASPGIGGAWSTPFFIVICLSFMMLINGHYKQFIPMMSCASIAFISTYYLSEKLDIHSTYIVASFLSGCCANIYSKIFHSPSIVGVLMALLILVPGGLAVNGFSLFIEKNIDGGLLLSINVVSISISLSIGFFLSFMFVKPAH